MDELLGDKVSLSTNKGGYSDVLVGFDDVCCN